MFSTVRDSNIPSTLLGSTKDYRSEEVISKLNQMFFGKCYLCEKDEISDVEVEHLIPHKGNDTLKYDWNNLFYSCSRCNGIKSTKENILNCTTSDVSKAIELRCPSSDTDPVIVNIGLCGESKEILATRELLDNCYNDTTTGIRGISRQALIESIIDEYVYWLDLRKQLRNKRLSETEYKNLIEKLEKMCKEDYPFSAFWKWHIYRDSFLKDKISVFANE